MLTRKLSCPSCGVGLKIADTLAAGARISCPKCGVGFPVPKSNGHASHSDPGVDTPSSPTARGVEIPRSAAAVRARKPATAEYGAEDVEDETEKIPAVRTRRRPPPPEDEVEDFEERPVSRKRRKKRKKSKNNTVLIVSLVLVGLLLLGGGVTAAILLWPTDKKTDQVASSPPPGSGMARRGPPGGSGAGERVAEKSAPSEGSKSSEPAPAEGSGSSVAEGQQIFQQNCTRCHRAGGSSSNGPGGGRGGRGPDLSTIGRNHDEDWFVEFVRNPKSQKPDSRMPKFEGKLSEDELRAVARYLASLR